MSMSTSNGRDSTSSDNQSRNDNRSNTSNNNNNEIINNNKSNNNSNKTIKPSIKPSKEGVGIKEFNHNNTVNVGSNEDMLLDWRVLDHILLDVDNAL